MRSTADQTVSGIIERWSASFNKLDADALASLYSKNAFFFGSNPSLYCGHAIAQVTASGSLAAFEGL
jgi:ketosteroid isomerase-like protein